VNALEYVVIPSFTQTMNYIDCELDELSKEDFYRLKKVLNNKRRDAEIELIAESKKQSEAGYKAGEGESDNIFGNEKQDEDVFM
jgi:V-type H+-transporting ATPase subunit D